MKNITTLIFLCLISCQSKTEKAKAVANHLKTKKIEQSKSDGNELFRLQEKAGENFVKIIPPKNSDFEFPDDEAKLEPYKHSDFNADGKQDILVYLGACGTGGCIYGLFLNQSDNYYKLAFMDYLKNPEFITEKDGL